MPEYMNEGIQLWIPMKSMLLVNDELNYQPN